MACNFLNHWFLQCFGGQLDNPNGNENMFDLFLRFRFRWLRSWFGDDPEIPETSIQGYSGNMFNRFVRPVFNDVDPNYYWQRELARHLYGQYSMAVAQANLQIEDRSQLVSGSLKEGVGGPRGVFVGIYDGHGGATCSQFVLDNLFENFKSALQNHDAVNPAVIQEAYHRTEVAFVDHVRPKWVHKPRLAVVGSCCLVGVVSSNVLYVANAGDSRAVLARWPNGGDLNDLEVIQLSVDYTANDPARRVELLVEHPSLDITEKGQGKWYIRGVLQVYNDLRYAMPSAKRGYHDDISIVIVFFDNLGAPPPPPPPLPPPQENPQILVDNLGAPSPPPLPPPPPPQENPLIPVDDLGAPPPPPEVTPAIPVYNLDAQALPPPQADPPIDTY